MPSRGVLAAVATVGLGLLLGRGRRSRRRRMKMKENDDDMSTTAGSEASSYTHPAHHQSRVSSQTPLSSLGLSGPLEDLGPSSWQWLVLLFLLGLAAALAVQQQAWRTLTAVGLALASIVSVLAWSRQKRGRILLPTSPNQHALGVPLAASPTAAVLTSPDPRLAGIWLKDGSSDPMDTACAIMKLNPVIRMAVCLVRGIEVKLTPSGPSGTAPPMLFEMAVFSVVKWFKVKEQYELNGTLASFSRRDFRRGKHVGRATVLPDGGVRLVLEWAMPFGGHGSDEFRLSGDAELHVVSHLEVGGRKHTYTTVYKRKH